MAAFLRKDYNVISIDYVLARWPDYLLITEMLPLVAKILAGDINELVDFGVDPDDIILAGFSLGAQLVGLAGQKTYYKIGRVVGEPVKKMFPI